MRIGFVSIIREAWGGSEELWSAGAHSLLDKGHEVVISALNTGSVAPKMRALMEKKARLIYRRGFIQPGLPFRKRVIKKIIAYFLNSVFNPYQRFFNTRPDLIVYTGGGDAFVHDPHFLQLLYANKIPLVFINQGYYEYARTFDNHQSEVLIEALNYSSRNLFVAERNKAVMERFLGAEIPNAELVRNPVNLSTIEPIPFPEGEDIHFAMVGNLLVNHKGQDLAIAALGQEKWTGRNWHLHVYGTGIDHAYLEQLVKCNRLQSRVSFHGKVSDIREIWKKAHLLLMPSRFEGIPLAMVEAMICGRPVVATDVAGHTEWITEGMEGFIAEAANTGSFDLALERAWQRKKDWESMGVNAHHRALSQYDPDPGKTLASIILKSQSLEAS